MKVNMVTPWNFVCGNADYAKKLVAELKKVIKVGIIEIDRPEIGDPFYFNGLASRANKNCDIIHIQHGYSLFGKFGFSGVFGPLFYWCLDSKKRIITTLHDVEDYDKSGLAGRLRVLFRSIINRNMFNKSDIIHVHTRLAKENLISRGVEPSKIVVSPLGIFGEPKKLDKGRAKSLIGLKGKIVITIFGFIHESKGHDIAIKAMKNIDKDFVLLIAGKSKNDAYIKRLKSLAKETAVEKRVIFYGEYQEKDLPLILNATDVVLLPYRKITQSSILNTALMYKIPVVTSRLGFFSEIEREYGCLLTFGRNERGLASAIRRAVNSQGIIKKPGLEKYLSERSPDNIVRFLLDLYGD